MKKATDSVAAFLGFCGTGTPACAGLKRSGFQVFNFGSVGNFGNRPDTLQLWVIFVRQAYDYKLRGP
jgi:hypothetical protein